MSDLSVNRTLVKSPPELWSEVSEVESLARHLGELGDITITRLEPEHTVAWEGEDARGTVELEASGWGTKVTLSAVMTGRAEVEVEVAEEASVAVKPEPAAPPELSVKAQEGAGAWWSPTRWLRRGRPAAAVPEPPVAEPVSAEEPAAAEKPPAIAAASAPDRERVAATLEATLDTLGAAHHRPFSREG